MKFSCGSCHAQYMISDEKVGTAGVRVRCKKCGNVIHVKHVDAEPPPEDATVVMTADKLAAIQGQIDAAQRTAEPPKPTADEIGQAFDSMFAERTDEASSVGAAPAPAAVGPPLAALDDPDRAETRVLTAGDIQRIAGDPAPSPLLPPPTEGSFDSEATVAAPAPRPPSRPPDQVEWFVAIRDEQVGPLSAAGVKERWDQGEVGPDTLVWCTGLPDWKPLSSVDELAHFVAPAPAAAPAPRNGSMAPEAPAASSPSRAPAAPSSTAEREDSLGGFKPSAASALASLASMAQEEMEAAERAKAKPPEPVASPAAPSAAAVARSPSRLDLFADLPPPGAEAAAAPAPAPQAAPASSFGLPPPQVDDYRAPARSPSTFGRPEFGGGSSTLKIVAASAGAALLLLIVGGVLLWALVLKPQREAEDRRLAEITAAAEAAKKTAAAAAAAPAPPPAAPAPSAAPAPPAAKPSAPVAAAPQPAAKAAPAPPPPAPEEHGKRHGSRRHGGREEASSAPAAAPPPGTPPPPPSGGGGDDFLNGSGGSSIDKEFARELDGQGDSSAGSKTSRHSTYIPPPPGQADLPDSLSQSDIMQVIVDHKGNFARCKNEHGGGGTIVMHWRIKPDGHTADIKRTGGDLDNPPLAGCLTKAIAKLRFGQYRGSAMAPIDFPFTL